MEPFSYKEGRLHCEGVDLEELADEVGTPFYVYSAGELRRRFLAYREGLEGLPHLICYSVKACSNVAVLRLLARLGAGADIVSAGELRRAEAAGIPMERVVYSGVGKRPDEIRLALERDILMFNCESQQELALIDRTAREMGTRARVAVRVNPDVDPKTHPYISTGLKRNKFGIPHDSALAVYEWAARLKGVEPVGIDCHIGSQLISLSPFVEAVERVLELVEELWRRGVELRYLDVGGGLGIRSREEEPPTPQEYCRALREALTPTDLTLIVEPGRSIAGPAGALVTRLLYVKQQGDRLFYIVDGGMNDLARPSLYDAYHRVLPVRLHQETTRVAADVVGPICESGDFFARERELPPLEPGELLAVMESGAYGFSMASNYNSRPRPPEVLVDGRRRGVIRRREEVEELMALEAIPHWLEQGE